jgi:hypothetical protein
MENRSTRSGVRAEQVVKWVLAHETSIQKSMLEK